jgi:hypothetical protein
VDVLSLEGAGFGGGFRGGPITASSLYGQLHVAPSPTLFAAPGSGGPLYVKSMRTLVVVRPRAQGPVKSSSVGGEFGSLCRAPDGGLFHTATDAWPVYAAPSHLVCMMSDE